MKKDDLKQSYNLNRQIRAREVRVVSEGGSTVMPTAKAIALAEQRGEDLVEISPNAAPPVCRIIDYSKFLYQIKKKQKEIKAKQVKIEVKEIRFGPQTDEHDYDFKLKHATRLRPMYSSKDVASYSRNKEKYYYSASPMIWKK